MKEPNPSSRRILKAAIERKQLERAASAEAGPSSPEFDTSLLESRIQAEMNRLLGNGGRRRQIEGAQEIRAPLDLQVLEDRVGEALRMFLLAPEAQDHAPVNPVGPDRDLLERHARGVLQAKLGRGDSAKNEPQPGPVDRPLLKERVTAALRRVTGRKQPDAGAGGPAARAPVDRTLLEGRVRRELGKRVEGVESTERAKPEVLPIPESEVRILEERLRAAVRRALSGRAVLGGQRLADEEIDRMIERLLPD